MFDNKLKPNSLVIEQQRSKDHKKENKFNFIFNLRGLACACWVFKSFTYFCSISLNASMAFLFLDRRSWNRGRFNVCHNGWVWVGCGAFFFFSFSKVSCITLMDTFWTLSNFLSKGRSFSFLSKQDSCLPSCDVAIHPNSLQLWSLSMKWSTHVALGLGDGEALLGLGQLLLKLGLDHLLLCQPARNEGMRNHVIYHFLWLILTPRIKSGSFWYVSRAYKALKVFFLCLGFHRKGKERKLTFSRSRDKKRKLTFSRSRDGVGRTFLSTPPRRQQGPRPWRRSPAPAE